MKEKIELIKKELEVLKNECEERYEEYHESYWIGARDIMEKVESIVNTIISGPN